MHIFFSFQRQILSLQTDLYSGSLNFKQNTLYIKDVILTVLCPYFLNSLRLKLTAYKELKNISKSQFPIHKYFSINNSYKVKMKVFGFEFWFSINCVFRNQ